MPDLADYEGQVVLVVAAAERGAYLPLCGRYGTEGFALLEGESDTVDLIGRDGAPAASFPAGISPDDAALVQAIERELFASE